MIKITTFAHTQNNDTAYVSVQMNRTARETLRQFMHASSNGTDIMFPRNVRLSYRGFGWYRLDVETVHDAAAKLGLAVKLIQKCVRTQVRAAAEDQRAVRAHTEGKPMHAYLSSDVPGHAGRFIEGSKSQHVHPHHQPREPRALDLPASTNSLASLQQRFARPA